MSVTGGGPALPPAAVRTGTDDDSGPPVAIARAPRLRTVLSLAAVEAWLLVRSLLVLVGLLAGGFAMWLYFRHLQPLWWDAAWRIGWGQLILSITVLAAAQLAAGRARRNGMADLYASFPATAATRTAAHLAGLVGVLPASLLLGGAAAAAVQSWGAVGTPDGATLAGGLLLVIAAGAAGVAIGTRFPHPLAGAIGAVVLLFSSVTSHLTSGAAIWLVPWEIEPDQVGNLPGPLAGYPPSGAHAVELAGLAVLAAVLALAVAVRPAWARVRLAAVGIVAVAAICVAGALQAQPIPSADLNHLIDEVANPASVQSCTAASQVRYCLYPGFGSVTPSLESPVGGVLAHLPAQPGKQLTIRQVASLSLPDSALTHGHSDQEVSRWDAQAQKGPGYASAAPAAEIYFNAWPPAGQQASAQFSLALATAQWALDLPAASGAASGPSTSSAELQACVPVNQAREAIAIWLAIVAAHPSTSDLESGLGSGPTLGTEVDNSFIQTWSYAGGNVTPSGGGVQDTATGYLLAKEMTGLPQQKVSQVLAGAWSHWLNWHTTDAQLAAALGIAVPKTSSPASPSPGSPSAAANSAASNSAGPGNGPQASVCTT